MLLSIKRDGLPIKLCETDCILPIQLIQFLYGGHREAVLVGLAKYSPFCKVFLVNHLVLSKAHTTQPTTFLSPTAATFVPTGTTPIPQPSTTGFSIQDLALLLASTKKDHLPEWKLAQDSGDPLQWHEWFGRFKSAIDATPLTDDVKLTYLKTLVTGKAKTAISEFAYCGAMYRDALKTLERKFGQPQTVVTWTSYRTSHL